jgi:hypothetical protein
VELVQRAGGPQQELAAEALIPQLLERIGAGRLGLALA